MTLVYRGDDGFTDESASNEDSMPGLVNDSDEEEADMVYQHTVQLPASTSSTKVITTDYVMSNDSEFVEAAMCKFINELRVAETDIIEPEFIEECPICGLLRYPDDPKHIDICHLHVFCTVCQRYEGAYFGVDRCDGLPTMDDQMMQPITKVHDHEQADVVFISDATYTDNS